METNRGRQEDIGNPSASPELRKYIRIQIVGMSIFLSWPVAICFAEYFRLNINLGQLSVLMIMVAVVVFCVGLVGRQELKAQEKKDSTGVGEHK